MNQPCSRHLDVRACFVIGARPFSQSVLNSSVVVSGAPAVALIIFGVRICLAIPSTTIPSVTRECYESFESSP